MANLYSISFMLIRETGCGADVNLGAILDPYAYENGHLINVFEFAKDKKLARLTSANLSFGYAFKSSTKADEKKKKNPQPVCFFP